MRNFPDWHRAYVEYFDDGFVPPQFNAWAALTVVGAALERKVWLPWSDSFTLYPNIYALLVSKPGEGKSQALSNAVDLLEQANKRAGGTINILPNQATEAAFIKLLGQGRSFQVGTKIVVQSAAFYRASEASASLRNIYGEFLACLTDLYDCPNKWERATIKDGITPIQIKNVCINLLACSTFDYLAELVNDKNIMGGFASRMIYVLSQKKGVTAQLFQGGIVGTPALQQERETYRNALIEDLLQIHKIMGPMQADDEFKQAWQDWWLDFETKRRAHESEKMQSLLVRTNLHMLKVSQLFSACESDDRILRKRHWDSALAVVMPAMGNIPTIFRESRSEQIDGHSKVKNIPHAIVNLIIKNPEWSAEMVKSKLVLSGANQRDVDSMISRLITVGKIGLKGSKLEILGNADEHF